MSSEIPSYGVREGAFLRGVSHNVWFIGIDGELDDAVPEEIHAAQPVPADSHGRTNVANLYAAGDAVGGVHQIAVAVGQAAIAATAVHNVL